MSLSIGSGFTRHREHTHLHLRGGRKSARTPHTAHAHHSTQIHHTTHTHTHTHTPHRGHTDEVYLPLSGVGGGESQRPLCDLCSCEQNVNIARKQRLLAPRGGTVFTVFTGPVTPSVSAHEIYGRDPTGRSERHRTRTQHLPSEIYGALRRSVFLRESERSACKLREKHGA